MRKLLSTFIPLVLLGSSLAARATTYYVSSGAVLLTTTNSRPTGQGFFYNNYYELINGVTIAGGNGGITPSATWLANYEGGTGVLSEPGTVTTTGTDVFVNPAVIVRLGGTVPESTLPYEVRNIRDGRPSLRRY